MVDSVSGNPISTLLRAQSVGLSSNVSALKTNQQSAQAIIDQLQSNLSKNGTKSIPLESAGLDSTLPRGSLVNILV